MFSADSWITIIANYIYITFAMTCIILVLIPKKERF